MDTIFSEKTHLLPIKEDSCLWPQWVKCMKDVHTKEELMYQLEKLKRVIWNEIEGAGRGTLELKKFGVPKMIFHESRSKDIGPFIVGKKTSVKPRQVLEEWFQSIGIKYEVVNFEEYVYFRLFL